MAKNTVRVAPPPHTDIGTAVPEHLVDLLLDLLRPIVRAVGTTVGPHCEVVLHDLRVPEHSIVAIQNGAVTGRQVGGPVVGGPTKDVALKLLDSTIRRSTLSTAYTTFTQDGRELRSTSFVMRTPRGKPVIALCLNLDLSAIKMARLLLERMAEGNTSEEDDAPEALSAQADVGDIVARMIRDALQEIGKPPEFMDRDERLKVVETLHERGLFLIRGGVERTAAALGISRFTLYSYLKEVRNR